MVTEPWLHGATESDIRDAGPKRVCVSPTVVNPTNLVERNGLEDWPPRRFALRRAHAQSLRVFHESAPDAGAHPLDEQGHQARMHPRAASQSCSAAATFCC
jgi:hypothetical protein